MPLPALCIRLSFTYGVAAVLVGLGMAMSGNHAISVAHAHLVLIGWLGLLGTGLLLRAYPALAAGPGRWIVHLMAAGAPVQFIGIALDHSGVHAAEPLAVIGSFMVAAAIAWQALRVWTTDLGD
ncbi:hypothetical protein ACQ5SO_16055 [Rhodovulum sp. DZ06]|uniref:hypothetical protein n=1 Tax=Rhodovulum sp. DZ06 TaxID=3425126 RepID=UPI003D33E481